MKVPGFWSGTDTGPVNGVVWFRRKFELPQSADGKPARLMLGRIVDADTTYVNGTEVGRTTYQYPPRRYDIGEGILRAGENTIAARVVSSAGEGGFVDDKPYELQVGETRVDLKGLWRFRIGAVSEPMPPPQFVDYKQPLGFYNAMLAPLQNMTIKGVIWYQGESNVERAKEYRQLFPAMIRDWRKHWGQGDFPFIFVQLANFLEPVETPSESAWAELRDAQLSALGEPYTAMAVAIDVGEWNDIHPLNKKAVGHRLALAARKIAYGESDLVSSGPIFRSMTERDGRLTLEFDFTGCGLTARGGELRGFAISGTDDNYVWAQAAIDGDKVVVWNDSVAEPAAVRYAWADNPVDANLYNCEGLPASPFQASVAPERN
jgi:sialate O-acetylesterase